MGGKRIDNSPLYSEIMHYVREVDNTLVWTKSACEGNKKAKEGNIAVTYNHNSSRISWGVTVYQQLL